MRRINLNFMSASSYGFWNTSMDAFLVRQFPDGLYGVIYMDPITPYMVTASEVYIETNSDISIRNFVYMEAGNTVLDRIVIAPDFDVMIGYG